MGHSMGAALSSVTASVVKGCKRVILVDFDAPFSVPNEHVSQLLKLSLAEQSKIISRKSKIYMDFEETVKKVISLNPYIKESSVRLLNQRGLEKVIHEGKIGFRFIHDPKLVGKPPQGKKLKFLTISFVRRTSFVIY
jgi:predicted nuclease with RNAse H fold